MIRDFLHKLPGTTPLVAMALIDMAVSIVCKEKEKINKNGEALTYTLWTLLICTLITTDHIDSSKSCSTSSIKQSIISWKTSNTFSI